MCPGEFGSAFPTTTWSLVIAAGGETPDAKTALAALCASYWYPVFAFVRRQGHASDVAQDLTQGFFTRLIEKGDIAGADRGRGRFRSFLLAACQHYLSNEQDRARALKRGGIACAVPIDVASAEGRYALSLTDAQTPERLYERQWALTLLASAIDDLRAQYAAARNEAMFSRLKPYLTVDDAGGSYADAARDLAMSEGAIKVAVHRLRRRYRDALRARVATTVTSEAEIDDEIGHLIATLSDPLAAP